MTEDLWRRVEELFYQALELPVGARRAEFLNRECNGDAHLLQEVQSLLASSEVTLANLSEPIQRTASRLVGQAQEGDRIGPYRIVRMLGRGGMGVVFLAERDDDEFRQKVAIKLMNTAFGSSESMVTRFRAERQILAQLDHPNIARLLDGGTTPDGQAYLVMEYIDGEPLDVYCNNKKPSVNERLKLFLDICSAVEYAHRYLVIHRDLKPVNILVTADGVPKLLDFGVARLLDPTLLGILAAQTNVTERLLTPQYASPEQIRGEPITTATDVFGIGLLLYQLLTGVTPFRSESADPMAVAHAVCNQDAKPPSAIQPDLPRDLDFITLMALRKEPSKRYATVAQFAGDVRAFLDGFPVSARSGNVRYRMSKFIRRHKLGVALTSAFVVALIGFGIGMSLLARRAERLRAASERESDFLSNMFLSATPDVAAGKTITARDLLDHGAERLDSDLAGAPEVQAELLGKIGLAYRRLEVHDKAMEFTKRALDQKQKLFGKDSVEAAVPMETLAELYRDESKLPDAETLLRRVVAIRQKSIPKSEAHGTALADLGEILFQQDKYSDAEATLRASAEILRKYNSEDLIGVDNYLAQVLDRKGAAVESVQLMRESLETARRLDGPSSRNYANSAHNLGGFLMGLGDYIEGGEFTRIGLEVRRKILPPDHPDLLYSLGNMAFFEVEGDDAAAAQAYVDECLRIAKKAFGENNYRVAVTYRNLGRVKTLERQYADAEASLNKALQILTSLHQAEGVVAAATILGRSQMDVDRGKFDDAKREAQQAIDIFKEKAGQRSPLLASALIEAGLARELSQDAKSAEPFFRQAFDIRRTTMGEEAPGTINSQIRLAECLMQEGNLKDAEPLLKNAAEIMRKVAGAVFPWQRAEANSALGEWFIREHRLKEAEPLLSGPTVKHPRAWWLAQDANRRAQLHTN